MNRCKYLQEFNGKEVCCLNLFRYNDTPEEQECNCKDYQKEALVK